jgi:hypothetical protein
VRRADPEKGSVVVRLKLDDPIQAGDIIEVRERIF